MKIEFPRFENLHPHEQRMVAEFRELKDRINACAVFMMGEIFKALQDADQSLLQQQYFHMRAYRDILERRIAKFL